MWRPDELYRKTHRVNAHQVIALGIDAVNAADYIHNLGYRIAGKFISKYKDTDFFTRVVKGSYGLGCLLPGWSY